MGSQVTALVPLTTTTSPQSFNMKIKNLFSFSSHKSSKPCEGNENTSPVRMVRRDLQSEYRLKEMLGKGGFGRVFSAVRISDGLEVAIKEVIKDDRYQNDNKNETDIPTEVALMQQVQNIEGVIKILDYIDDTDCYQLQRLRRPPQGHQGREYSRGPQHLQHQADR